MEQYLEGYQGMKVLGARLAVRIEKEDEKTPGGLILIQDVKEPKYQGIVVATGAGARMNDGQRMPMDVEAGDNVIYSRMAGVPIEWKGEELLIINERDVIAVINE